MPPADAKQPKPVKPNKSFFVIAHNIRSLYNVGSIFRTADACGVSKLFLTGFTGTPLQPKLAKVSLGAENFVPWEYVKSPVRLIKRLRQEFPKLIVYGLENNLPARYAKKVTYLNKLKPKFPSVLVLGEETNGIPKSLLPFCDSFIEIPMQGQKESLNVSVAFGVAAYQIHV